MAVLSYSLRCFNIGISTRRSRYDITTLIALYGHGSETILFFSMGHGKVIQSVPSLYGSISIFFEIFCNKV